MREQSARKGKRLRFGPLLLVLLAACSSAPKRPAELFAVRRQTETQLELANKEADRGHYEQALVLLDEARRLAVSADDPALLVRTGLSRGNILFHLDRREEAQAVWDGSLAEAEKAGNRELAAASRIYLARSRLLAPEGTAEAGGVIAQVQNDMEAVKKDQLYTALGWTVIGLAEKENRRWDEAENALKNALAIHNKNNYLEQAAYDWYLIASVRSVAGRYPAAQEALSQALAFDRRAENSYGLGMDWLAAGDVHQKAGDAAQAQAAWSRAAEIFRAIGLENEAALAEERRAP